MLHNQPIKKDTPKKGSKRAPEDHEEIPRRPEDPKASRRQGLRDKAVGDKPKTSLWETRPPGNKPLGDKAPGRQASGRQGLWETMPVGDKPAVDKPPGASSPPALIYLAAQAEQVGVS